LQIQLKLANLLHHFSLSFEFSFNKNRNNTKNY